MKPTLKKTIQPYDYGNIHRQTTVNVTTTIQKSAKPTKKSLSNNRQLIIKLAIITFCLISLPFMSSFNLTNEYLMASEFEKISAQSSDSFMKIASRYENRTTRQERLAAAIIEVNGLTPDTVLRAGQKLLIPIIKK